MTLILASASPRRAELLAGAGIAFVVAPECVDETPLVDEGPLEYVLRVAGAKASAASNRRPGEPVLGADTAVVAAGRLMGKPADGSSAREMLRTLSGATHVVHTGVVLRTGAGDWREVVTTRVRFAPLTEAEISWYVGTGEPDGKAGAYAIQGCGSRFIEWIEGSWSNVVGLPVATVYRMLKESGVIS